MSTRPSRLRSNNCSLSPTPGSVRELLLDLDTGLTETVDQLLQAWHTIGDERIGRSCLTWSSRRQDLIKLRRGAHRLFSSPLGESSSSLCVTLASLDDRLPAPRLRVSSTSAAACPGTTSHRGNACVTADELCPAHSTFFQEGNQVGCRCDSGYQANADGTVACHRAVPGEQPRRGRRLRLRPGLRGERSGQCLRARGRLPARLPLRRGLGGCVCDQGFVVNPERTACVLPEEACPAPHARVVVNGELLVCCPSARAPASRAPSPPVSVRRRRVRSVATPARPATPVRPTATRQRRELASATPATSTTATPACPTRRRRPDSSFRRGPPPTAPTSPAVSVLHRPHRGHPGGIPGCVAAGFASITRVTAPVSPAAFGRPVHLRHARQCLHRRRPARGLCHLARCIAYLNWRSTEEACGRVFTTC